jgi:hypothetical protein
MFQTPSGDEINMMTMMMMNKLSLCELFGTCLDAPRRFVPPFFRNLRTGFRGKTSNDDRAN